MKVYVVIESHRDWDDGWDNVVGVYLSQDRANSLAASLNEEQMKVEDYTTDYLVEEYEVIE